MCGGREDAVQVFAVSVGHEYLSKGVTLHQVYNLLYAQGVKLVKDVVQEQYRRVADSTAQQFKLCQLKARDEGFLLALRPFALHGVAVEHDFQVVAVDAVQ